TRRTTTSSISPRTRAATAGSAAPGSPAPHRPAKRSSSVQPNAGRRDLLDHPLPGGHVRSLPEHGPLDLGAGIDARPPPDRNARPQVRPRLYDRPLLDQRRRAERRLHPRAGVHEDPWRALLAAGERIRVRPEALQRDAPLEDVEVR